jgi:hypothetical protein
VGADNGCRAAIEVEWPLAPRFIARTGGELAHGSIAKQGRGAKGTGALRAGQIKATYVIPLSERIIVPILHGTKTDTLLILCGLGGFVLQNRPSLSLISRAHCNVLKICLAAISLTYPGGKPDAGQRIIYAV